jgi:hypothetical protein
MSPDTSGILLLLEDTYRGGGQQHVRIQRQCGHADRGR